MEISALSVRFAVRRLTPEDVGQIYRLSCGNPLFYRYHPPFVTGQSILDDMQALPPGKTPADKHYVGFFDGDALVAVMDLIDGYPSEDVAFIGLFMMDAGRQKQGIGSGIIAETAQCLKMWGFSAIRLGVDRDNPQSNAFWRKNGFSVIREGEITLMERTL